ncbi:FAD/NAD(P)-binding protein [Antribacter gilvus]|uniref:FAD/NAD(P)-binding protein n=1 Tax=Antribacter gilvus TaxID=2304675 RepID=UPI000F7A45C1|nr:FAD/NAD(P)-binding protein [Antribacter gilvus]
MSYSASELPETSSTRPDAAPGRHVAIVGGGPTAVAALVQLASGSAVQSVSIIAPNDIGLTPAFSAGGSRVLCNTSVDVTSLSPDGRSDLLDYLVGRGWPVSSTDFVPRYLVGCYLRERYLQARSAMRRTRRPVTHVRDRVVSISGGPGTYRLVLAGGDELFAGDVLICTGGGAPKIPEVLESHVNSPGVTVMPVAPSRLHEVPPGSRVLVLGSKLGAVDAALVLLENGCVVTLSSPSGRLPAVRTRLVRGRAHGVAEQWRARAAHLATQEGLRHVTRRLVRLARSAGAGTAGVEPARRDPLDQLAAEAARAAADDVPWQDIVSEVIDAMNSVLPEISADHRQRIMESCRESVSRYVSAIPERNARRLVSHARAGRLTLAGGLARSISPGPEGGWRVVWADGGTSAGFDHIVSAVGHRRPQHRFDASGTIILDGGAGQPRPGSEAGGGPVRVRRDLRLDRGPGTPAERIWALGATAWPTFPVVNYLRASAQHAALVSAQLEGAD